MKEAEIDLVENAEGALRRCLAGVPFATLASTQPQASYQEARADLTVQVELPDEPIILLVEVKSSGQPRVARAAVNQLARWTRRSPRTYGVFAAPFITERGADICAAAGVGYVDFSGNCRLSFGTLYIEKTGNPNAFDRRQDLRSLYAPKASRVLRVLLEAPRRPWRVKDLSEEAHVSLGHVSNVKKALEDREWASRSKGGLVLTAPADLLEEWAGDYSYRDNTVHDYYAMRGPADEEQRLAEACSGAGRRYALTMFSGAARLGALARYNRVFAYVEGDLAGIADMAGLKAVSSGPNVSLLTPYDEGVFYGAKKRDGVWVPSAIQTYLDLKGYRGRGEEVAEALLRDVIRRQW